MAGVGAERSQFDDRQYDEKMTELYAHISFHSFIPVSDVGFLHDDDR